ncbi:hypothetical protein BDF19DRAFT_437045 [Syncephalis fuscata]|nr:hypothetical protein BDF19DRAFT_437045 [Syncephalis fuscata]
MINNWRQNATTIMGIKLHPLGEVPIFSYISGMTEDYMPEQSVIRGRLFGFYLQIVSNVILSVIFTRNLHLAIKTIATRSRNFALWCCVISSALGIVPGVMIMKASLGDGVNCRTVGWYDIYTICISTIFCHLIVLQRAYFALRQQYWILVIGIAILLPQIGFGVVGVGYSYIIISEDSGCTIHYPNSLPWLWFGGSIPINLFFSGIFSHVAYKQYRTFGSDAWRRLARDGIQAMCSVTLCNIVCGLGIFFKIGGDFSQTFFVVDWVIASTILVNHCSSIRQSNTSAIASKSKSKRLQTSRIDIRETITTYQGRYIANTEFTSIY